MNGILKAFSPWLRASLIVVLVLSSFAPAFAGIPVAQAASPDLVIAQVYSAGGNTGAIYRNDFVVIFNRGNAAVPLLGKSIQYASATGSGNFAGNGIVSLTDITLAPGQYYLVQLSGGAAGSPLPGFPDASGSIAMAGSAGKVVLVNSTTGLACNGASSLCSPEQLSLIIDLVGYGGANFFEGAQTPALSSTTAAVRRDYGCMESDNNNSDFQVTTPNPLNTASAFHVCGDGETAPYITTTTPSSSATGVALNANLVVTFNEAVDTAGSWFSIACSSSGAHTATASGGPGSFTLDPDTDFAAGETCTATILAALITDQDSNDPPDAMAANYVWTFTTTAPKTLIRTIQGAGHISPLNTRLVADVAGIVTARTGTGFYMQDPNPDGSSATSEAVFVYTAALPSLAVGDAVEVDGTVSEYRPGGDSTNLTVTEIISPTIALISSGNTLPAPIVIGTGGRIPPNIIIEDDVTGDVETAGTFDPDSDGLDFYESLEAMRVQINNALVVGPKNNFGEVPVNGDNGANAGLRTPRGGIVIRSNDFNPERITLDDEVIKVLSQAMPNMNVGGQISGALVGVMDYSFSLFKLQVSDAPNVTSAGLAREVAQQPNALQLAVASFNAENLSAADSQTRFDTMAGLIINNLRSPDVLAIEEIQDNNGATNDSVVDASQTLTRLVDAIHNVGGPQYSYRQINPVDDQDGGQPGSNIRVAFLFRADRGLSFVDRPGADSTTANAVVSDGTGVHLLYSPGRIDPSNTAFISSRKPLAGEFLYNGKRIFIIANHFNSKGGDQPLFGRYQPPLLSSEAQRTQQAQVVHNFVQSIMDQDAQARVIVLGDLNDYPFSNPLTTLKGSPAILTALIETLPEAERYTYVFEGNSQALDHILVSSTLARRPLVYDSVHINAEFADQASDHDPQLLLISLPYQEFYLPVITR